MIWNTCMSALKVDCVSKSLSSSRSAKSSLSKKLIAERASLSLQQASDGGYLNGRYELVLICRLENIRILKSWHPE